MATIQEIALKAGYSKFSVSRALNDQPGVAPATRSRILAIARELSYIPDERARSLSKGSSRVLGFIIPNVASLDQVQKLEGVESVAHRHGYSVIFCNTGQDPKREQEVVRLLRGHRVDGIVVMPVGLRSPALAAATTDGVPIALMSRYLDDVDLDWVTNDNAVGVSLAVQYLAGACGRRRIAFLRRPAPMVSTLRDRLRSYQQSLPDYGLQYQPGLLVVCSQTVEGGYKGTQRLLQLPHPPDAVIVYADSIALGAFRALKEAGLRVPEDVAVVSLVDSGLAELMGLPLAAVRGASTAIGVRATELLLERIENPGKCPPRHIQFSPRLVVAPQDPDSKWWTAQEKTGLRVSTRSALTQDLRAWLAGPAPSEGKLDPIP